MDFLGHSILTLQSSDPGTLAAIVVLQAQVAFLQNETKTLEDEMTQVQEQIAFNQNRITLLQEDVKTQADEITLLNTQTLALDGEIKKAAADVSTLKQQVIALQQEINNLTNAIRLLQNAPSLADCGCLVLTCPVTTDTATLRVPISSDWDSFYSTGYSPPGSPFTLTPFVAVNFQEAANPFGVYWNRPTTATGAFASFEIDATAAFIPSIDMAVRVGVKVFPDLFSTTPMFVLGYNEQRYRPSANVANWAARVIVKIPLTDASQQTANFIIFELESRTLTGSSQQFVYGIGESFANQHHLIVKRIQ